MQLEQLGAVLRGAATGAVEEACGRVYEAAKALCPVDSGRLRESLYASVEADGEGAAGRVTAAAPYAAMVELGTLKQSAHPYLLPALAQARDGLAAMVAGRIRAGL